MPILFNSTATPRIRCPSLLGSTRQPFVEVCRRWVHALLVQVEFVQVQWNPWGDQRTHIRHLTGILYQWGLFGHGGGYLEGEAFGLSGGRFGDGEEGGFRGSAFFQLLIFPREFKYFNITLVYAAIRLLYLLPKLLVAFQQLSHHVYAFYESFWNRGVPPTAALFEGRHWQLILLYSFLNLLYFGRRFRFFGRGRAIVSFELILQRR